MKIKLLLFVTLFISIVFIGCGSSLKSLVEDNNVQGIEEKLKDYSDVNSADAREALTSAVYNGNIDIIKLLVDHGIKADETVMMAVKENRLDIVKILHPEGNPYVYDSRIGMTPVMQAAAVGDLEMLKLIFKKGENNSKQLEVLLYDNNKFSVAPLGNNALTLAIKNDHPEIVRFLLNNGFDPQIRFVISEAFTGFDPDLIKEEVKENATVTISGLSIRPETYGTPLSYAKSLKNNEIIKLLEEKIKSKCQ